MTRAAPRPAFTILELLLVMTILIIIAGVAYPTLSAMYGDARVKAAADQVRGTWVEARARAIEDGRAYRFGVQANTGKFRVAPDSSFVEVADLGEDSALPFVVESELGSGITFDVGTDLSTEGEWAKVAVFNPDGTCQNDIDITLREKDDDITPLVVRVRAMTGAITVFPKPKEGR